MTSFIVPTPDQLSLAQGIAEFLAGNFPIDRFRLDQKSDAERWTDLAGMGAIGISLPEDDGGLGLTWVDEVLVCREAGRYLLSPAWVGSVLAVRIAALTGQTELRDALINGECRAGIATIRADEEVQIIDGSEGLFVLVRAGALALIEPGESSMMVVDCIDDTVQLNKATLRTQPDWIEDQALALGAHLLLAAMLCGLLETTRDRAAEYARTRVQFGRPIGAFQAIKHRCADIALAAELCWLQTLQAVDALQSAAVDAEFHVLSAKMLAGDEALKAVRFNIQAHGGMGFTDEVDAHRLMKRAHVLHQLLDDPRLVRARLADLSYEAAYDITAAL
jgi:alkylation response protein AidB-like acyl-CoA dehydrogenase